MQITNQTYTKQVSKKSDAPIELKQGEVYKAQIKEKLSDNEALIQIQGKEVKAKFEGGVPTGNRVTVEVTGQQDQSVVVKAIATEGKTSASHSESNLFKSVGLTSKDSPELRQAVQTLFEKGQPLSKEIVNELRTFFEKAEGTVESKSNTVKALVNKGLEVTKVHLRAVHEALHGKPLNEVLTSIAKEVNPNFENEATVINKKIPTVIEHQKTQMSKERKPSISQNSLSQFIGLVRNAIEKEPDLQKVIQKVKNEIIDNPKIDPKLTKQVEKVTLEAEKLQGIGKAQIIQALKNAEMQLSAEDEQISVPVKLDIKSLGRLNKEVISHPQKSTGNFQAEIMKSPQQEPGLLKTANPVGQQAGQEDVQVKLKLSQEVTGNLTTVESHADDVVRQVKEMVQQEPRLQKAIEIVREQISNNPKFDREVLQKLEKAVQVATQLQQMEREQAGKEHLVQALSQVEAEHTKPKNQPIKEVVQQVREQLQTENDIKKVLPKIQEQIVNKIDPEIARNIEKAMNQANQLDSAGKDRLMKVLQQVEETIKQTEPVQKATLQNSVQTEINEPTVKQEIRPSETIQQILKQFQAEADVEEALNLVRKEVSTNPNMKLDIVAKIESALEQAGKLSEKGREIAARQIVLKELTEVQQILSKAEPKVAAQPTIDPTMQYDVNEQLQSLQIQSKDILVTRVTQKLAEVTQEFREIKRDISTNLDNVKRIIDTYKSNSYPQANKMLETAISKLDNAILKSDMMLFTDMKTERQLLHASTQLAGAKKLLAKGNFSEASKIVGEVKQLIDRINFKPSDQKVMHFVGKESMALENPKQSSSMPLENAARGFTMPEPSGRQMFEMVRSLGLNHDSELANSLVFKNGGQSQQEQLQQNMKAVLMKLQSEEAGTPVAHQAEQALNNVTGQQLLSKADAPGTMQSMLFNLPMLLGGTPENLQVFVNSNNEGQQVDWENCNLYFLLETKKLGEVGIMLATTDRNLSITIKNDKPGFKQKMEPIANLAKERLNELGYNVGSIHFKKMTTTDKGSPEGTTPDQIPQRPIFTEKGLDFKI